MTKQKIYIKAAAQISMQQPLSEEWMQNPILHTEPYVRSIEPNYRDFINPMEARRMGKLMKRALVTSLSVMRQSTIVQPDAIITGTAMGCIDYTDQFLRAMCCDGEELLKPTPFMQSTHNTISSLIAIYCKCHGYNVTYSHRGISFDSALTDALLQFRLGQINNALVGSHDELPAHWYTLLNKVGYTGCLAGEASVSLMLSTDANNSWCEIADAQILHRPSISTMKQAINDLNLPHIDALITEDSEWARTYFGDTPLLHYKHLFGESYSASALAVYAAACCLRRQVVPTSLYAQASAESITPRHILFMGKSDDDYSLILLQTS